MKRHAWLAPALIITGAAALKTANLAVALARVAYVRLPFGDAAVYYGWARSIIESGPAVREPFYRAPLYPCLLAALGAPVRGASPLPGLVANGLLGLATLLLVYATARRLFSRPVALVALGLAALSAPLLFFETKLLSATLVVSLVALGTYLLTFTADHRRRWAWLPSGAVFGLAALAWGGALLVFAAACAWALFGRVAGRRGLAWGVAGCVLALTPVASLNVFAAQDLVLVNWNSGFTFYQGNNPLAAGTLAQPPEWYESGADRRGGIVAQEDFERAYVGKALGRTARPSEISAFWSRRALGWIARNPGRYIVLLGRKLALALSDYESPLDHNLELEQRFVPPLRVAAVRFGLLFALAVAGLFLHRDRRRWPLYSVALGTLAALLVFFVADRYRLPAWPALCVLAASGAVELWRAVRFRKLRPGPVIAGVVALLVSTVALTLPARRGSDLLLANAWYNLGEVERAAARDPARAARAYAEAQRLHELRADISNPQEGFALAQARSRLAALQALAPAPATRDSTLSGYRLFLDSTAALGRAGDNAGALRIARAGVERWPADPDLRFNLALAAFRTGDWGLALASAESVLARRPGHAEAQRIAAAARARLRP